MLACRGEKVGRGGDAQEMAHQRRDHASRIAFLLDLIVLTDEQILA